MIHFNELYVTEDGEHLVIDTEIDNLPIYDGCVIDTISVSASPDCDKTHTKTKEVYSDGQVNQDIINNVSIKKPEVDTGSDVPDPAVLPDNTNNLTHMRLCLGKYELDGILTEDVSFSDHIFTVTVEADVQGDAVYNLAEITKLSCGWDENIIRGIAYNGRMLYDQAVNLASSYGDDCNDNGQNRFVDFILRYYAFMFAVKCGDIDKACYYWNNYLKGGRSAGKQIHWGGGCGCHGPRG